MQQYQTQQPQLASAYTQQQNLQPLLGSAQAPQQHTQQPLLAPAYEKCPKHPANEIVLFCLNEQCKEPLCKECCKLHIHWHNQQGTPAEIDTVDNVRACLYNDVHGLKIKFEEERAILHHFSDGEHSSLIKSIQSKLDQVKKTLLQQVNDYCAQLEQEVKNRIHQHKSSHPGEKKELHHKLNSAISSLDSQEKGLQSQKYIKACLIVLSEEKNHDLEGLSTEIDNALKHYLENMFDVFIHQDKLQKISDAMSEFVEIHQANLGEELDIYTQKIREGKKVYGVQQDQSIYNRRQIEIQPPISMNLKPNSEIIKTIYDQPASNLTNTTPLQYSRMGPNSKNYETRLQQNNEKLKQFYG